MTLYDCTTCGRTFPAGATGASSLILHTAMTEHLCSRACLRAYVNQEPKQPPVPVSAKLLAFCGIGMTIALLLAILA